MPNPYLVGQPDFTVEKHRALHNQYQGAATPGTVFPLDPTEGLTFYDQAANIHYYWNGSSWVQLHPTPNGSVTQAMLDSATSTKIDRAVESGQLNLVAAGDSIVQTSDGNGIITVLYPFTFSSTPQCVVLTNGEDGQGVFLFSMVARSTTFFTARLRTSAGAVAAGFLVRMNWIAMLP